MTAVTLHEELLMSETLVVEQAPAAEDVAEAAAEVSVELVEEDLLVEDVSIDGMCGVY